MSSRCPERRAARARVAAALIATPLLALAACRGNETPNFDAVAKRAGAMETRTLAAPSGTVASNLPAEDGQWTMVAKDYANTRYSGLAEISAATVKDLHVAWTWSTGNPYGHEGAPLVVGTTMYVVTPFPNELYALDLAAHGAVKWNYAPPFIPAAPGVSCCGHINRGPAYADGRVFFNTLDNQVVAM